MGRVGDPHHRQPKASGKSVGTLHRGSESFENDAKFSWSVCALQCTDDAMPAGPAIAVGCTAFMQHGVTDVGSVSQAYWYCERSRAAY